RGGRLQRVAPEVPHESGPYGVRPRRLRGGRQTRAGQRGRRVPGEGGGEQGGVRLVLGVRLGITAALHTLRGDREGECRVVVHLGQVLVELARRVRRVQDLLPGAPALRGPLLEQAERIPVAVLDVAQPG